jgi:hypothetical protein
MLQTPFTYPDNLGVVIGKEGIKVQVSIDKLTALDCGAAFLFSRSRFEEFLIIESHSP